MPRLSALQSSFTSGEFSPILAGQVTIDRYKKAVDYLLNYITIVQGGLWRRSGTYYVTNVKTVADGGILVPFEFSVTQAYILEFGDGYIRFYMDNGQIESGASAYEIATGYALADLYELKFTQSADVLFITHEDYITQKLSRTGHTSWTLTDIDLQDGPYLPTNNTATTLELSGTTGSVTVTASSTLFAATDVDRLIRWKDAADEWTWLQIDVFGSVTTVTATIRGQDASAGTATVNWRLGLYSDTTGYPACSTFHDDRFVLAGCPEAPQRFDMSKSGDYENFANSDPDGTIADDNAVSYTLNAKDVNVIRWMSSEEKGMAIGTVKAEWIARPSSLGEAITPTNISAKKSTSQGSANIQGVQVGNSTLFVQRAGRKLRELTYFADADGFRAPDLTLLSEHMTESGIKQLAYQSEPQSIVWIVRNDGTLVGMSYERDLDNLEVGWHRHILGGQSDSAGTPAKVESVAVIPSPNGQWEEVWMIVQRYINGAVTRSIEYMTRMFTAELEQKEAFFVDCGLTYDNPLDIDGGITLANPIVIGSSTHGLVNGDRVLISEVVGTSELNDGDFTVTAADTHTFALSGIDGTSGYTTYDSGGEVRKYISTLSGLDHLEGETVTICGDGAAQPDQEIVSGAFTLHSEATTVHAGLQCTARGRLLRIEGGSQDGTALGKTRKITHLGIMLYRSLGLDIGMDFDDMTPIEFRTASDPMSRAVALYTGIKVESIESDYDLDGKICWEQSQPLPSTILAIFPQVTLSDLG